jgi:hypothetical protein
MGDSIGIEIGRIGDLGGECVVAFRTVNGTALSGRDFAGVSVNVNFGEGEVSKEVSVKTLPSWYAGNLFFMWKLLWYLVTVELVRIARL